MQVNVTFRHLEPSDALKAFAREKVERVQKYLDTASEASIVLSIEKHLHHAEVLVRSGPFFLRGRERSDDMYASIGMAMEKIEKQLKRYKDRLHSHKPKGHHNEAAVRLREEVVEVEAAPAGAAEAAPAPSAKVVAQDEHVARRMTLDEAVLQLDLLEDDFMVFTRADNGHISVLYRRKDSGGYGLVDARPA